MALERTWKPPKKYLAAHLPATVVYMSNQKQLVMTTTRISTDGSISAVKVIIILWMPQILPDLGMFRFVGPFEFKRSARQLSRDLYVVSKRLSILEKIVLTNPLAVIIFTYVVITIVFLLYKQGLLGPRGWRPPTGNVLGTAGTARRGVTSATCS
jgi:hypothetical protein